MSDFKIGTTKLTSRGKGGFGLKNFHLEDGSNLFRVLPPMWSLADKDKNHQYWALHWGFTTTEGAKKPIVCIQRQDSKKVVYQRCPICDMVEEAKANLEFMKRKNATEEQLKEFRDTWVDPYERKGKYYSYAFNGDGELGILQYGKTIKDDLEARHKQLEEEGITLDGTNGVYVNVKKSGSGRFNTKYSVDVVLENDPANPGSKRYKFHTLTSEIINRLQKETTDLAKLYTALSNEDLALLANTQDLDQRKLVMDKLFARGEQAAKPSFEAQLSTVIPGTNAVGVVKVELNPDTNKMQARSPEVPNVVAPLPPTSGMSDEEFRKIFNDRFGGQK